ncbi:hypothetical protein [Amycolatopsis sp. Hca4]|nr:hypothetical protein [Amycolatopsis sp. Hca4]QKV77947.1 hypothetical protein HUT10_32300 [Amycolatopsis sp. Hca4]
MSTSQGTPWPSAATPSSRAASQQSRTAGWSGVTNQTAWSPAPSTCTNE